MHSSTKKAAEPKRLTKNGKVYGDLLSAEEKKKLVLQKKKAKKTKKVRQSAQQTIPYVEMCRDGICKVNSRLYTKTIRFNDINYQLAQFLYSFGPSSPSPALSEHPKLIRR